MKGEPLNWGVEIYGVQMTLCRLSHHIGLYNVWKRPSIFPRSYKASSAIYFSVCGLAGVSLEERPLGECLWKPVLQESFSHISKRQPCFLIIHKCLSPTKISHMNFKDRDPTSSQIFLRWYYRHFKLNMLKTESHFSLHHQKQRQNIALLHDSHSIRNLCVILEDSTLIPILI